MVTTPFQRKTRSDTREAIKRYFGWPMVKVELDDSTIDLHLDFAVKKFTEFAIGQSTQEVYFTVMLSGGQSFYPMPDGTRTIVSLDDNALSSNYGGINTLFTLENYLYMQGQMNFRQMSDGYGLVSLMIARGFLETLRRFTATLYQWRYHESSNTLEIIPAPATGNQLTFPDGTIVDSPGFVLLRAFMLKGATEPNWTMEITNEYMFALDWVYEYAIALSKITLGNIRAKFSNYTALGNAGISLDGADLRNEGMEEKKALEERLDKTESWMGMDISIG